MGCTSLERTRGGGGVRVQPSSGGEFTAGGVLALGAEAGGALVGEFTVGGEEEGGDASLFCGTRGGELVDVKVFWSSGVGGPERTGGAVGSPDGGGEVGRGGADSSDGGKRGASDSGGGGEVGNGGAGASGGGGEEEEESGRAGPFGRDDPSRESSLKQTHVSPASSLVEGACSGPKILSKSAIEGFLLELSSCDDTSGTVTQGSITCFD